MKYAARLLIVVFVGASSCGAANRPPQFVLMAFDNCTELERWREVSSFIDGQGSDKVRFTFFLSGVNFLADKFAKKYSGPGQLPGKANINFGGEPGDVESRVNLINAVYNKHGEMASHAVGHFWGGNGACDPGEVPGRNCGAKWTEAQWNSELSSFRSLVRNVAVNNGLPGNVRMAFPLTSVKGFRAPQLSENSSMYKALRSASYAYDTSVSGDGSIWPLKLSQGLWQFKLAELHIAGLNDPNGHPVDTLSMDFNFCVSQSAIYTGKRECAYLPSRFVEFRQQMFDTYINYFEQSYNGNRAPVNIGHHFYDYQGGIYKQALWAFARAVCGLPEVRCVTYSELVQFLELQSDFAIKAYQIGDFPKTKPFKVDAIDAFAANKTLIAIVIDAEGVHAELLGDIPVGAGQGKFEWSISDVLVGRGPMVPLTSLPDRHQFKLMVRFVDARGVEVAKESRILERNGGALAERLELGE